MDDNKFDPDEILITKNDIINRLDNCIEGNDGIKYRALVNMFILSLKHQSTDDVTKLFKRFLKISDDFKLDNATLIMKKDFQNKKLNDMLDLRI